MPELPEVETIRTGLEHLLTGKVVRKVTSDTAKSFPNEPNQVKNYLIGAKITDVKRRAKVLIINLDNDYALIIHLKMTGQLIFVGQERFGGGHPTDSLVGELPDRSTRVIFEFIDGTHLYFNDFRKFGWVKLVPKIEIPAIDFFKTVGPEPLGTDFTWQNFARALAKRKKSTIKAAILDQKVVAGVGNIYADESLFAACIHPATRVADISSTKLKRLWRAIPLVLQLSIDLGGSSDKNYVDAQGNKGSYLKFAKVFRREGQVCPECGGVIEKIRVAGRGTHYCPKCQKLTKPAAQSWFFTSTVIIATKSCRLCAK